MHVRIPMPTVDGADCAVLVSDSCAVTRTYLGVTVDGASLLAEIDGADALLALASTLVERAGQITADEIAALAVRP